MRLTLRSSSSLDSLGFSNDGSVNDQATAPRYNGGVSEIGAAMISCVTCES